MKEFGEFAEIDLFEEDPGMSIPARAGESGSGNAGGLEPSKPEETFRYISPERSFVEEAKAYADRQETAVPFVPFMSYWPTYRHMNDAQLAWYFYWRSEVRQDRFPDTDLSYIFVYIYELINGIGWEEPGKGYRELDKLGAVYGSRYAQLNRYLGEWTFDFTLAHSLDVPLTGLVDRFNGRVPEELLDTLLQRGLQELPSPVGFNLLLSLSDYDLRSSKFYQGGGKADLEFYLPRVVALVDSYLQKSCGAKLIEHFAPGEAEVRRRHLFRSAVYDAALYGTVASVCAVPIHNHAPLRKYMTHLFKFTENKLREHRQFKGRLREIELEQNVQELIGRYLLQEFAGAKSKLPAVVIDRSKLAALQKDTDEVRDMLTVEEQEGITAEEPEAQIGRGEESQPPQFLPPHSRPSKAAAADKADTDEVKDEAEDKAKSNVFAAEWDVENSGLDEDWRAFAAGLNPCQLHVLFTLKSPEPKPTLLEVAEQYGTLPAPVLDQINELAMETIGDLVIDGEELAEDYRDCFEDLKGGWMR